MAAFTWLPARSPAHEGRDQRLRPPDDRRCRRPPRSSPPSTNPVWPGSAPPRARASFVSDREKRGDCLGCEPRHAVLAVKGEREDALAAEDGRLRPLTVPLRRGDSIAGNPAHTLQQDRDLHQRPHRRHRQHYRLALPPPSSSTRSLLRCFSRANSFLSSAPTSIACSAPRSKSPSDSLSPLKLPPSGSLPIDSEACNPHTCSSPAVQRMLASETSRSPDSCLTPGLGYKRF